MIAQDPSTLKFEVASVKRNTGEPGQPFFDGSKFRRTGTVTVTNMSLGDIIRFSYTDWTTDDEIASGPGWIRTDRFDIIAKGEPDSAELAEADLPPEHRRPSQRMLAMMRSLLEERFKLRVHNERRATPIYLLELANGTLGPNLKRSTVDCAAPPVDQPTGSGFVLRGCGVMASPSEFRMTGEPLAMLASYVSLPLQRRVEDRTGTALTDRFDFSMVFDGSPASGVDRVARIVTALKDLGLRLTPSTAMLPYIVIDHIEPLTPN